MSAQHPASVSWTTRLLTALVALGAVVTLLIVVLQDQLIRSWAQGRPDTRKVLRARGLQAVKDGEVHVPQFIPVALTLFVVVALLIWVLSAFLRGGYGWARVALTITLFFLAVGTIAGLRTGAPATFMVLSVASFPLEAAAAYFLWHKDTGDFLRGAWTAPEIEDAPAP
jgi:FtsH-binding integral membrane protein